MRTDSATILVLLIPTLIIRSRTQVNVTRSGRNGLFVHSTLILCTILSGSADPKTALVCSIAEGANATSGMGRLTLHRTMNLVVISRFLPVLPLHIHLSRGTFAVALMSLFLQAKEKVLRRARRLRGTDGDGV